MLSLATYYIILLVKNCMLTSLTAVLCTKTINMLRVISQTTHYPWPLPHPSFTQILTKPQQGKEGVQWFMKVRGGFMGGTETGLERWVRSKQMKARESVSVLSKGNP